jgi:hypothetical protein
VAKDILVRIRNIYIPTDFIVLDMGQREEVPLLLGRPFLNTTNVVLHVGTGHACFHIQGQTIRCPFNGFDINKHVKTSSPRNNHTRTLSGYGRQEGAIIRVCSSGHGCTIIKQELKDKSLAHRTIKGEPSPKVIGSYLSYL